MKCPRCGSEIISGYKFCTKCGMPVDINQSKSEGSKVSPQDPAVAPKHPSAPMPHAPSAPRPMAPRAPQPMAPQAPSSSISDEKGFFARVGAGIASATTGGSFSTGYDQQREREHSYELLVNTSKLEIENSRKIVKELLHKFPDTVSATDEMEVEDIILKIQEALTDVNAEFGDSNGKLKGLLKKLQAKVFEMRVKADPTFAQVNGQPINNEAHLSHRETPVVELHDINPDELAVVRNKAIWGMQPGQIARRITERELDSVEGLNGFIIQEGCQAMIFVNGSLVDTMDAGAYTIPQRNEQQLKAEFDKLYAEMEKQNAEKRAAEQPNVDSRSIAERGGLVGIAGEFLHRGWEFIFGASSVKPSYEKDANAERIRRLKAEVEKALKLKNQEPIISVIIASKRNISLSFGGIPTDSGIDFQPYTIPSGIFDVKIGIMLQLKVSDIKSFTTNYLSDRNSVTTNDFFHLLNTSIENTLRQNLRNFDYQREGLSPETVNVLKQQISSTINQQLFGIQCDQILQITDSNDQFERFRQVERELYCSEKELDFMQRTGEFRNRLEQEANKQQVNSAHNAEDLAYALQQVNKDHLLHEDEMSEFVLLLDSQRRIREAKTSEEEFAVLADLRKSRLVKQDEIAALEDALLHNKIERYSVTELMRIQHQLKIDNERLRAEWVLNDQKQDHDWEREDLERRRNWGIEDETRERAWMQEEREYNRDFSRMQQEEEYDWQKRLRERELQLADDQINYDRTRQEKFDSDQLEANRSQRQIEKLQAMAEMQAKLDAQRYQNEQNLAAMQTQEQMNRDTHFANMTPEQIRAAQLSHLQGEAQVAMANAYGSEKESAFMREQIAQQNAQRSGDMDRMERMFNQMGASMLGMGQSLVGAQAQRADEYKQEAHHQQQRMEHTQDEALANISKVSTAAASNIGAFRDSRPVPSSAQTVPSIQQSEPSQQSEIVECQCYNCKKIIRIPVGTPQCPECGAPFQW